MSKFKVGDRVEYVGELHDVPRGSIGTIAEANRGRLFEYAISIDGVDGGVTIPVRPNELKPAAPRKDVPRVGDTVRVVLEGRVGDVDDGAFSVRSDIGENYIVPAAEHVKSIEIIKPAGPSAKDLPVGSVVRDSEDAEVYIKLGDRLAAPWVNAWGLRLSDAQVDATSWTLLVEQSNG
jgi:hypothetical protein